ncbi:MAG TPA: transposase [Burkholderiales bacterium]
MSLIALIAAGELRDAPLLELHRLIDWAPIERELAPLRQAERRRGGPEAFAPLILYRALLVQRWHRLSLRGLNRALRVRLDFLVFVGLEPGFPVPSVPTVHRARLRLEREGVRRRCDRIVAAQLQRAGVTVKPANGALTNVRIVRR